MRLFFLLTGLLLPQVLLAQFNSFEPGSYVLTNRPNIRHECKLKLRSNEQLVVKDANGKNQKLTAYEVLSFRLGERKYTTAGGFQVSAGIGSDIVSRAFVEQLDSGQVVLLSYEYSTAGAPVMGAGGTMMYGMGGSTRTLYLLRRGYSLSPIPANSLSGGGKKFREALLPYMNARPDLAKLIDEKLVTADDLPAIIHALNTGQPFAPTPYTGY
jgi:hypothetical protein